MAKIHRVIETANASYFQQTSRLLVALASELPLWTPNRSFYWISCTIDQASAILVTCHYRADFTCFKASSVE